MGNSANRIFSSVATIACLAQLGGCVMSTKPSELRSTKPVEYSSSRNAKAVALCAYDEWEKKIISTMKVQMREKSNGFSVWVEVSVGSPLTSSFSLKDNAIFVADIDNTKTGSITHFYDGIDDDEKYWASELEKCLNNASRIGQNATLENQNIESENTSSTSQKLREIHDLKKDGLINEDEFQNKKKQILDNL